MAKAARPVPEGFHTITPHLTLDDAASTIDWYVQAFGAKDLGRSLGPDGRIMHAEVQIGDSRIFVNDPMPGMKGGPREYSGSPASLWLYVEDADALFQRAVSAGATVAVPLADQFWGDRGGAVTDPAGYTWWIATRKEELTDEELNRRAADAMKQMSQA